MAEVADVTDISGENQFELTVDGHTAMLVYRIDGNSLVLIHTEVPDELAGQGIGGTLVRAAIERSTRDGLTIVPRCPFARRWLERHPDEIGGVGIDW